MHGDRSDLLDWLDGLEPRPRQVFAVHGTADAARAFAGGVSARLGVPAIVPTLGEQVLLE